MKKFLILLIFSIFFFIVAATDDDEFSYMHSASFNFTNGIPFIRAHIKSYPSGVKITDVGSFYCNDKKIFTPTLKLSPVRFEPGEVKYMLSFAEITPTELKDHVAILSDWAKKTGIDVNVFAYGAIFSINESRIDNREYFITAKETFAHDKAHKYLAKYRKMFPDKNISLIPVLTKTSSSVIQVVTEKGKRYNCMNTVLIKPESAFTVNSDKYEGSSRYFFSASKKNKLEFAVEDSVESLVEKILPGEMFLSAPLETLKAQAVAARTDIFMQLGKRHVFEPWHICSEVHCQKVLWGQAINQKFVQATKETAGMVLIHNGSHIARAPYCSSAGGRTEDIRNVWFTAYKPYLSGVWDGDKPLNLDLAKENDLKKFLETDYGEDNLPMNKRHRWQISYQQKELDEIVNKSLDIGKVHSIESLARGVSGRIYKAVFKGEKGAQTVYGELNIRKILNNMFSSAFVVQQVDETWTFSGAGWGHGVGMSQMGAISLGGKGRDFKFILKRYYPKTEVQKIY